MKRFFHFLFSCIMLLCLSWFNDQFWFFVCVLLDGLEVRSLYKVHFQNACDWQLACLFMRGIWKDKIIVIIIPVVTYYYFWHSLSLMFRHRFRRQNNLRRKWDVSLSFFSMSCFNERYTSRNWEDKVKEEKNMRRRRWKRKTISLEFSFIDYFSLKFKS